MSVWLSVVGIGEDGLGGLSERARCRVAEAEILVGDERVKTLVSDQERVFWVWPRPLRALFPDIAARRGQKVCIFASGDPLHFGIGSLVATFFPADEVEFLPHLSAFTLACARMGWIRSTVETVSLHNASVSILNRVLFPGARILSLTRDGRTPGVVATHLVQAGWGQSRITVLERLGGGRERVVSFLAASGTEGVFDDLHVLAIDCEAERATRIVPWTSGVPDDLFDHDGMLTKREVRAVTLSALAPVPGQLLWDVGAGCGSIALEWLRLAPRTRAIAIERNGERVLRLRRNAEALGVPGVVVVEGEAPESLAGLEPPDAIFIGGGLSCPGVIDTCWSGLKSGGHLVANTVSLEGERVLLQEQAEKGGDLIRFSVARLAPLGGMTGWKPLMPVTQWSAIKP